MRPQLIFIFILFFLFLSKLSFIPLSPLISSAYIPYPHLFSTPYHLLPMARFPFNFSRRTYLFLAAPPALYYTIQYLSPPPKNQHPHSPTKKNVVILGTGWAATSLLHKLNNENLNVTVISPRNYFLFTPLLPSCTTGTVECRSVMQPVREMARYKETEVKVVEGEAVKIDAKNKTIQVTGKTL